MKRLIILSLLLSFSAQASTVARVLEVKGKAFAFNGDREPTVLKYGDKIEDLSDIMVEDTSHLSIVNTDGHVFHITGGSLLKLFKKNVELKNGQVWTVSKNNSFRGTANTTNALVEYGSGQFVLGFDNITGKTQLMVITGDVKFANSLEPSLSTKVNAGFFSIIDPDYENNLPRTPTKVGKTSFTKLRSEFAQFETLDNPDLDKMIPTEKEGRSIASVVESYTGKSSHRKGKLIMLTSSAQKSTRTPASAHKYYMQVKKQKKVKLQSAPVRYFGETWKSQVTIKTNQVQKELKKSEPKRVPASIPAPEKIKVHDPSSLIQELKKSPFEKSVEQKEVKIKRHSDEVNNLIDQLKTYRKDYQKNY